MQYPSSKNKQIPLFVISYIMLFNNRKTIVFFIVINKYNIAFYSFVIKNMKIKNNSFIKIYRNRERERK